MNALLPNPDLDPGLDLPGVIVMVVFRRGAVAVAKTVVLLGGIG